MSRFYGNERWGVDPICEGDTRKRIVMCLQCNYEEMLRTTLDLSDQMVGAAYSLRRAWGRGCSCSTSTGRP